MKPDYIHTIRTGEGRLVNLLSFDDETLTFNQEYDYVLDQPFDNYSERGDKI